MEHRKLIQHGKSSLTIALPSKWLKLRKLKKGDDVFLKEEGSKLIVGCDEGINLGRIAIDITGLDRTSTLLYLQSLYRHGYDEIEIRFQGQTARHFRKKANVAISAVVHESVNRLIGMEIIEQSDTRILVKAITKEAEDDFQAVLRRIFMLLIDASASLHRSLERNDKEAILTIYSKHINITKFVSYCLRLLNKYGYPDVRKTCFYYHIIASIDNIMDILKYCALELLEGNYPLGNEATRVWGQVHSSIESYHHLFYKFNLRTVIELSKKRDDVKRLINVHSRKFTVQEAMLLARIQGILEIILDLTEMRLGLEN